LQATILKKARMKRHEYPTKRESSILKRVNGNDSDLPQEWGNRQKEGGS